MAAITKEYHSEEPEEGELSNLTSGRFSVNIDWTTEWWSFMAAATCLHLLTIHSKAHLFIFSPICLHWILGTLLFSKLWLKQQKMFLWQFYYLWAKRWSGCAPESEKCKLDSSVLNYVIFVFCEMGIIGWVMRITYDNICEALTVVFLAYSEHWINDRYCYYFVKQFLALVQGPLGDIRANKTWSLPLRIFM